MVVIERCEKRPGIFTGARTYRLVLNEQGLYILELGKAMGYRNKGNAIADKILDSIEKQRLQQDELRTLELEHADLAKLVENKKNFFVKKGADTHVEFKQQTFFNLIIKSPKVKMKLYLSPNDVHKATAIVAFFQ